MDRLGKGSFILPHFFSIDTGVDFDHPSLGNGQWGPGHKIVGGYDFVGDAYNGAMLFQLFSLQLTA